MAPDTQTSVGYGGPRMRWALCIVSVLTKTLSDGYNYPRFANEEFIGRRRVADGDRWHDVVLQGCLGEEGKENQMERELPRLVVGVVFRAQRPLSLTVNRLQTSTLEL